MYERRYCSNSAIGQISYHLSRKPSPLPHKFAPIAVQWADLLWPVLLLLDIEKVTLRPVDPKFPLDFVSYPITHSLLMGLVWGLLFGMIYYIVKKDSRGAIVLGLCVFSHWVLDLIVHNPVLPLLPGNSPKLGLGLWNNPIGTAIAESLIFLIGLVLYLKTTRGKNTTGKWSLWATGSIATASQHPRFLRLLHRIPLLKSKCIRRRSLPPDTPDPFHGLDHSRLMPRRHIPAGQEQLLHPLEPLAPPPYILSMSRPVRKSEQLIDRPPHRQIHDQEPVLGHRNRHGIIRLVLQPPNKARAALGQSVDRVETGRKFRHHPAIHWTQYPANIHLC